MPCDFPEHHGGGGGGFLPALVVLLAALAAVAVVGPLLHILAIIVHVVLIAGACAAAGAGAVLALGARRRVRRRPVGTSPLAAALGHDRVRRQALPRARRAHELYPPHITADDIADALIRRHQQQERR